MMARMPVWVRRSLVGALGLAGFLVLVDLATTLLRIVAWRTRWRPGIDAVRWYNKKVENPMALKMGGKRITAIHHSGRKSGRDYVTPVWAERSGQWFFIQLPYGTEVDWCRNVLAAGCCALEHNGVRYDTVAPVIVPVAEAVPFLPPGLRRMQRLVGVEAYLRLDIGPAEKPARKAGSSRFPASDAWGSGESVEVGVLVRQHCLSGCFAVSVGEVL